MRHEDATLPRRALLQRTAYALTALTAAPLLIGVGCIREQGD